MQLNEQQVIKSKVRAAHFGKWWKSNRGNHKGYQWLCTHSRRITYAYNLPPFTWDEVQTITKRWHNSEHKRISRKDAWTLWKIMHPLMNERTKRLQTTGEFLLASKAGHKAARKQSLSTNQPKKEVDIQYKTSRLTNQNKVL